jgi:hypothetical protein
MAAKIQTSKNGDTGIRKIGMGRIITAGIILYIAISYWSDNPELSQCTSKNKQMKGVILLERLKTMQCCHRQTTVRCMIELSHLLLI